jgi:hypothetical protein
LTSHGASIMWHDWPRGGAGTRDDKRVVLLGLGAEESMLGVLAKGLGSKELVALARQAAVRRPLCLDRTCLSVTG